MVGISDDRKIVSLEKLRELIDETKDIEIDGVGWFRLRKISIREFIEMQEDAIGDDGETDEWEAMRLLFSAGIVEPDLASDEELLGSLPISLTKRLTEEIAAFAGTDPSFDEGSPTE